MTINVIQLLSRWCKIVELRAMYTLLLRLVKVYSIQASTCIINWMSNKLNNLLALDN